uniref:YadA C-terminal domain-containing protein n=1 Tax=Dialister sp. TaxID=1955814 RepID=UPI004025DCE5
RVDISSMDGKSATSLLQGNDGTFTIQRKDYENGGQTTVLASYSKDGTYDAKGHDMKNIGQLSAKSLSVGQITDVETAINKNKADVGALDDRVTTNENMIKNNTDAINILDEQNKAEIGRLDGRIDTNATNIAQNTTDIRSAETAIKTNANGIAQNKADIQRLDGRVNKVGANAAALAALHPLDYDASDKWSVAAGVGNYGDANAMAIGAFYRPNEDVMLNMAGSFGSGENMVNAGISFKVGQRGMKAAKAEGADVKALQEKVEAQDKEIKELREMVEKLVAKA